MVAIAAILLSESIPAVQGKGLQNRPLLFAVAQKSCPSYASAVLQSTIMVHLRKSVSRMLASKDLLSVISVDDSKVLQKAGLLPVTSNFELSIVEQELASSKLQLYRGLIRCCLGDFIARSHERAWTEGESNLLSSPLLTAKSVGHL